MNRSWALSPWLQVPFGLVLLLLGVVVAPSVYAENQREAEIVTSGRVCETGTALGAADCLVPVPGRITDQRGRTSQRYRFLPDDPVIDDEWVRFPGDERGEGGAMAVLLSGAPVTALYAGDSILAFDVGGERVTELSGEPGNARSTVWFGLFTGSVGLLMLSGAWYRRRQHRERRAGWDDTAVRLQEWSRSPQRTAAARVSPHDADPPVPDAPTHGWPVLLNAVLLVVMTGSICAFFAGSLRSELITFAVAGSLMALLMLWGQWLQRRRTR